MQSTTRHFDELQSMRRLAALLAVLGTAWAFFKYSIGPMLYVDPFLNGAAVIAFFFVLRGTVLAMSWKTTPVTGSSYLLCLTKRAFRIMPLLIVVAIVAWGPAYGRMVARLPRPLVIAAALAGLVLFLGNRYWWPTGHGAFSSDLIEMAVSAQLIAIAIYVPDMFPALRNRVLVFIGDISYSIYLIHFLIMVATLQLLARLIPPETMAASPAGYALLLAAIVSLITIGVSTLTYRVIEMPLTVLGKQVISHGQALHGRVRRRLSGPGEPIAMAEAVQAVRRP